MTIINVFETFDEGIQCLHVELEVLVTLAVHVLSSQSIGVHLMTRPTLCMGDTDLKQSTKIKLSNRILQLYSMKSVL